MRLSAEERSMVAELAHGHGLNWSDFIRQLIRAAYSARHVERRAPDEER